MLDAVIGVFHNSALLPGAQDRAAGLGLLVHWQLISERLQRELWRNRITSRRAVTLLLASSSTFHIVLSNFKTIAIS